MNGGLQGKKVAILVANGFEQSELELPRAALMAAHAASQIVSPEKEEQLRGWAKDNWGDFFQVDARLPGVEPEEYDALVLPGGLMNLDKLRQMPEAVEFVRAFFGAGKPVAALCHGPQILIEAEVVRGRKLTSYPSLKTDLINAGARWLAESVVVDQGLITSRWPEDLPVLNERMIEEFAAGVHVEPQP